MLRVSELNQLEGHLSDGLKKLKMDKEGLLMQKNKLNIQYLTTEKRIHSLNKEILRVSAHPGVLIDTDVWIEGVTQRCRTKDLLSHLHRELVTSEEKLISTKKEMDSIRHVLLDGSEAIAKLKRDCDKLSGASKIFTKALKLFKSTAVQGIVKNLSDLQEQAMKTEQRRAREKDIEKMVGRKKVEGKGGEVSNLDKVRLTDSDLRTKEERQFVAIDLVLYPDAYFHLTIAEAEQMQFDSDYSCPLSKPDIERIMKLPEQVNLALPFLSTDDEINVHKLVNKYYRGIDDNTLREKDFYGPNYLGSKGNDQSIAATNSLSEEKGLLDSKDMQESEIVHDILVRESLRDRLRSMAEDEPKTIEEQIWLQLDRILSPHIYDKGELQLTTVALNADEKTVNERLSNSVIESRSFPSKSKVKPRKEMGPSKQKGKAILESGRDGDVYEALRSAYSDGTSIFDENSWICPFSREELLKLRDKPLDTIKDINEILCIRIMQKYFVSEDESTLGNARLRDVAEISRKVANVVVDADMKATEKLANLAVTRANIDSSSPEQAAAKATIEKQEILSTNNNVTRIWGSWDTVHPASAGVNSQAAYFYAPSFNSARVHPASYAVRGARAEDEESVVSDISEEDAFSFLSNDKTKTIGSKKLNLKQPPHSPQPQSEVGVKLLTGSISSPTPSRATRATGAKEQSPYLIAESLSELTKLNPNKVRGKIFLLQSKESEILLEVKDATLQARQSRSHYFSLPEGENSKFIIDVTVSIVFQGDFGTKGYKLGRLAAGMFRLPDDKGGSALPSPVGFAPYAMQAPNLPGSLGRIVLLHKPKEKPLKPGTKFQVVIGAAAATKYSIEISSKCAVDAIPVLDEEIEKAKTVQARLPLCLKEIDAVQESIRLTERKLALCNKMIQEAEAEADRCEKGMQTLSLQLEQDDEDMQMLEDERRQKKRELSILEIEYSQWAANFSTRGVEKKDIQDGLNAMYKFQHERLKEWNEIKINLEKMRSELPSCVAILRNLTEAVHTAAALNTSLHGVAEEIGAAATGDFGGSGMSLATPAEEVRRRLRQGGFDSLLLEEQQWCLLDQALNPTKYEWLREIEEKEKAEREATGKKPKDHRNNAAIEAFRCDSQFTIRNLFLSKRIY